jgi:hypothetical protein
MQECWINNFAADTIFIYAAQNKLLVISGSIGRKIIDLPISSVRYRLQSKTEQFWTLSIGC